jgi:hypothetical protein
MIKILRIMVIISIIMHFILVIVHAKLAQMEILVKHAKVVIILKLTKIME